MKKLKENDLLVLIIAFVALALFVSACIVAVKLMLRGIYSILDHVDTYNFGWNVIGYVGFILLIYGTYKLLTHDPELKRIKELTEAERSQDDRCFLDQIESESMYCGQQENVEVSALLDAAKRARKDKALKRDIRMELDKAINQCEKSMSCQIYAVQEPSL